MIIHARESSLADIAAAEANAMTVPDDPIWKRFIGWNGNRSRGVVATHPEERFFNAGIAAAAKACVWNTSMSARVNLSRNAGRRPVPDI